MSVFNSTTWRDPEDLVRQVLRYCADDRSSRVKYEFERTWMCKNDAVQWILEKREEKKCPMRVRYINSIWLSVEPELRVRAYYDAKQQLEGYKICYKGNGGLKRAEADIECSEDVYNSVSTAAIHGPAHMFRGNLAIPMKAWVLKAPEATYVLRSIDYGFMYLLEIEFDTQEEAEKFVLPEDLIPHTTMEVTDNPRYKMKNYWNRTRVI